MKKETREILDNLINLQEENERLKNRLELYNNALNEKITQFKTKETDNLQDRIKELETINEKHRKINGELREENKKMMELVDKGVENSYIKTKLLEDRIKKARKLIFDNYGLLDKYGIDMLDDILKGE